MKNKERNFSFSKDTFDLEKERNQVLHRLPRDYSPPTLSVRGVEQFPLVYSINVNLTIQLVVSEFKRKTATLLIGQALFEILSKGMTVFDWMVLEFLYSYLLGQKLDPLELKDPKESELCSILRIVLSSGNWLHLSEYGVIIPDDLREVITSSKYIPNSRTYSSRKVHFLLKDYLIVRIVPVDKLIERQSGTVRYSSYCKGYGESNHMGRRKKTGFSSELDGEEVDLEKEKFVRIPFDQIQLLLQLNLLEIRYKSRMNKRS